MIALMRDNGIATANTKCHLDDRQEVYCALHLSACEDMVAQSDQYLISQVSVAVVDSVQSDTARGLIVVEIAEIGHGGHIASLKVRLTGRP